MIQVEDPSGDSQLCQKMAELTVSKATSLTAVPAASTETPSGGMKKKHFPASGHLRHFIRMAEDDKYSKREVVGLVMFAAEGDNSSDAKEMASMVAKAINVEVTQWIPPKSWEGVFGDAVRRGAEEGLFW
jgi:hypothetical protein